MKSESQIRKDIKNCEYFIKKHKEQIEFYLEEFNPNKIASYAQKIIEIQVELDILLLVLNDS
ncbi:MAG: hypothetical protein GAK29_01468 [Acinetobacter bereziniae]|uniref:Uncharacterized protein n=1 Tax=Acinetobacter bereziniae TaxID=106648 RepID=A0A833PI37_ACIBZ|nr:MAG: hypothetical protein GAK29_01468 [Acinetobacter bereziniae]